MRPRDMYLNIALPDVAKVLAHVQKPLMSASCATVSSEQKQETIRGIFVAGNGLGISNGYLEIIRLTVSRL